MPYEDKMKAPHPPGHEIHRGYSGLGLEKVNKLEFEREDISDIRVDEADLKESFESGRVDDKMQPNIWPPEEILPGFRNFMESFYTECDSLCQSIFACMALALDLPDPTIFTTPHVDSPCQLRILHYPPVPIEELRSGAKQRITAHSDFDTATILFQDATGGLEVEDPRPGHTGEFRQVEPQPAWVLVNVGDLLERWTNGRWRSSMHRVGAPPASSLEKAKVSATNGEKQNELITPDRYSVPFFSVCHIDTVIDALPGCFSVEHPKKWEPIKAWDYIMKRMAMTY